MVLLTAMMMAFQFDGGATSGGVVQADGSQIPYDRKELFRSGSPRVYKGAELSLIAFPLGGIGTGSISVGGWGQLRDFEIFNRPAKGLLLANTFFTLYAQEGEEPGVCRVLQGPVAEPSLQGAGMGIDRLDGAGLPHFRSVEFEGSFPFARLRFGDPKMPLGVEMEAYNPFIPHNPDDSGLPAAMFNFKLSNPGGKPVRAVLFANLENKSGHPDPGQGRIEYLDASDAKGLFMTTEKHAKYSPRFGSLALATSWPDVKVQTHWYRGTWFDSLHRFWDLASRGEIEENREPATIERGTDTGTIALEVRVEPGKSVRLPVWIVWHTPIFEKYWDSDPVKPTWRNHYATRFEDAAAVVRYLGRESGRLERDTRLFADALHSSTLPACVLDAVSSQISILKSTTCLRLEDGTFYGFEGCHPGGGCCEGTCTHVWNYAQALAWLFPGLERSVREADYRYNLHEDGHMTFRMPLPLGRIPPEDFHAAADGQLGGILKLYREWQISGDDEWLKTWWPKAKCALAYAWKNWDPEKEGIIRGVQHNTYDIEFHGPNTMIGGFYLGALRAAEEISIHLGNTEDAKEYRALFESGRRKMEEELYNGEYYIQKTRSDCPGGTCTCDKQESPEKEKRPEELKYQYGSGCLSDQMIGQWYARMLGLGDLFEPEHVHSALSAIFRHNWKSDLSEHANPQRIYALNDEAGLLLATWPRGGRPEFPFPYSDEVWCGIEYQVASHLIYEGFLEEGLAIVKGVRDRHTGERRNPWNEFECGNHYARSMASYALLLALSDYRYCAPEKLIQFRPQVNEKDFQIFFSTGSAWGVYRQKQRGGKTVAAIDILHGSLELKTLILDLPGKSVNVSLDGRSIEADWENQEEGGRLELKNPVTIAEGKTLEITGR
jgi:uncharacterized protein (DUF608 family)